MVKYGKDVQMMWKGDTRGSAVVALQLKLAYCKWSIGIINEGERLTFISIS